MIELLERISNFKSTLFFQGTGGGFIVGRQFGVASKLNKEGISVIQLIRIKSWFLVLAAKRS